MILTWERQPKYYDWEEELVLNGKRDWFQGKPIIKYVRRTYNGGWQNNNPGCGSGASGAFGSGASGTSSSSSMRMLPPPPGL